MPDTITVYEKPTCTKCREMDRFLRESSVDFSKINYYLEPIGEKKLRELIKKMAIKPRELLRTSEAIYRELGLGKKDFSDDEIISLLWLRQWYQNGGSDRIEVLRRLEFLKMMVKNGKIEL